MSTGPWLFDQSYGKAVGTVPTVFHDLPEDPGNTETVWHPAPQLVRKVRGCLTSSGAEPRRRVDGLGANPGHVTAACVLEALRVRRISPAEKYVAHRSFPASRSVIATDTYVRLNDRLMRVESAGAGLRGVVDQVQARPGDVASVLRYERLPEAYGPLRPALAILEAGHACASVALALARMGLEFAIQIGTGPIKPGAVVWTISLGARTNLSGFRLSNTAVRQLDCALESDLPLGDLFNSRSSGWTWDSLLSSQVMARSETDKSLLIARLAAQKLPACLEPGTIRVIRHSTAGQSAIDRTIEWPDGGLDVCLGPKDGSPPRYLAPVGLSIAVDLPSWMAAFNEYGGMIIHFLLGWIAQWACLASGAESLVARPVRAFDETEWGDELQLPLDFTVMYQIWIRRAPAPGGVPLLAMEGIAI